MRNGVPRVDAPRIPVVASVGSGTVPGGAESFVGAGMHDCRGRRAQLSQRDGCGVTTTTTTNSATVTVTRGGRVDSIDATRPK
ncbi:hypothetical protein GCM10027290_65670 [Micromonospora sonneratiae]